MTQLDILYLNLLCKDHVTVKQVGNFVLNYGGRVLNETKNDPDVMFRLQSFTIPLTFCLYNRSITKDGIVFFLKKGYLEPQHIISQ